LLFVHKQKCLSANFMSRCGVYANESMFAPTTSSVAHLLHGPRRGCSKLHPAAAAALFICHGLKKSSSGNKCVCHSQNLETSHLLTHGIFYAMMLMIISASLAIRIAEQSAYVTDHVVPRLYVCPHVCIVAKRLIGSGCRLGW